MVNFDEVAGRIRPRATGESEWPLSDSIIVTPSQRPGVFDITATEGVFAYISHDAAVRYGKADGRPFRVVAKTMYVAEPIQLTSERQPLSRDHYNYIPVEQSWVKVAPKGDGGQSVTVE